MNITVLNLPRTSKPKDLINLFATYGKVQSCEIVMDKVTHQSKGFAFVEMINDDDGLAAISGLHNTNFDGKRIRVKQVQSA